MEDGDDVAGNAYLDRLEALASTWEQWATIGSGLADRDWSAPSRCSGWDVACLYAHHSLFPLALSGPRPAIPAGDEAPQLSAGQVLRHFNVPDGVAHSMAQLVEDRAAADARRLGRDELVERFEAPAKAAVDALRRAGPRVLVPWPQTHGVVPLEEGVRIVVLEAVVHLLDVLRALGRSPVVPEPALRDSVALLAELAPPVDFIEAATGRSDLSPLPVLR